MHRKAAESDIIIVNHHLFFADLAIKMADRGRGRRRHPAGLRGGDLRRSARTGRRGGELLRGEREHAALRRTGARCGGHAAEDATGVGHAAAGDGGSARARAALLLAAAAGEGRLRLRGPARVPRRERRRIPVGDAARWAGCRRSCRRCKNKPDELHMLVRRAQELQVQLGFVMENQDKNTVFWIERRGPALARQGGARSSSSASKSRSIRRGPSARFPAGHADRCVANPAAVPVRQAGHLGADLGDAGGEQGFDYARKRLGLEHAHELVVPSHFDYEKQALLYVPARPARPALAGLYGEGGGAHAAAAGNHARAAPSACSPATRRCTKSTTAC